MKLEGYLRPILVQLQWTVSVYAALKIIVMKAGFIEPVWFTYFSYAYPGFVIGWLVYYFKRGRNKELENVSRDNPELQEIKKDVKWIKVSINKDI
jgi:hypothetical protein